MGGEALAQAATKLVDAPTQGMFKARLDGGLSNQPGLGILPMADGHEMR